VPVLLASRPGDLLRHGDGTLGIRLADGSAPGAVANHRGFVFARLRTAGTSFVDALGPAIAALDNLADRAPAGGLEITGGCVRTLVRANWKIYLENINDTLHAVTAHESAATAASSVWSRQLPDAPRPHALQQLLPFGAGYDSYHRMGGRCLPNGHTVLGTAASLHGVLDTPYAYRAMLEAAHGPARTADILAFTPQNAVLYPSLSIKTSPQALRVLRPLGPDRTVVEAWTFRVRGAPATLLERGLVYNRLVFSPLSVVAHDDLHIFESIQAALGSQPNPWISLQREHRADEDVAAHGDVSGTSEALMRHQYRTWLALMRDPD
jgi:phenylpropionate dioxygenase-like ring-hydroxylating dioxygenase large terminal subunit